MKRIVLFTLIALMLFVGMAYAGIWDNFKDVAVAKVLGAIISGIFFVASIFFAGSRILRLKKAALEGKDVAVAIYNATRPSSPGGAQITGEEVDKIIKEAGEFGVAVFDGLASTKAKK